MPYFSDNELKCKCGCGILKFSKETRRKLNELRLSFGSPIIINSGYRCKEHNIAIGATQTHASGHAVDIDIERKELYRLLPLVFRAGFTGIGFSQKGVNRFLHIDDLPEELPKRPRPHIWSY